VEKVVIENRKWGGGLGTSGRGEDIRNGYKYYVHMYVYEK
jgi:hypothetical protein